MWGPSADFIYALVLEKLSLAASSKPQKLLGILMREWVTHAEFHRRLSRRWGVDSTWLINSIYGFLLGVIQSWPTSTINVSLSQSPFSILNLSPLFVRELIEIDISWKHVFLHLLAIYTIWAFELMLHLNRYNCHTWHELLGHSPPMESPALGCLLASNCTIWCCKDILLFASCWGRPLWCYLSLLAPSHATRCVRWLDYLFSICSLIGRWRFCPVVFRNILHLVWRSIIPNFTGSRSLL